VTIQTSIAGVDVELLPDRAMLLRDGRALIVADVHWGKAASFRAQGVPVPRGTTQAGLARLDDALTRTGATRLYVLGDLLHARNSLAPDTVQALER